MAEARKEIKIFSDKINCYVEFSETKWSIRFQVAKGTAVISQEEQFDYFAFDDSDEFLTTFINEVEKEI
jgi:hypothetical protein